MIMIHSCTFQDEPCLAQEAIDFLRVPESRKLCLLRISRHDLGLLDHDDCFTSEPGRTSLELYAHGNYRQLDKFGYLISMIVYDGCAIQRYFVHSRPSLRQRM